jgi:hypothetical protein
MPAIMCTRNLWSALGGTGSLRPRQPGDDDSGRLGAWAAKSMLVPEGHFAVALNERTYVAVAFPFCPFPPFIEALAAAVGAELLHLGVSPADVEVEISALRSHARFRRNSNRSLVGSLNTLCHDLAWYLEDSGRPDAAGMLALQHMLTQTPHVNREPHFADESVAELFGFSRRR